MENTMTQIDRLLGIMQRLRDPENGCPWDKEQTFATIAPYTLEETYEVLDAISGFAPALDLTLRDLQATLEPGRRLVLSGSLPAACGPRTWSAAPLPPEEFGTALVATLWSELGGHLDGQVRNGITPVGTRTLLTHDSPPLADIIRDMNKWSSNVIARQLLALCPAFDCLDEYRARCFVPGHWVTVCAETETYAAKALAIDEEGRLVIQRENGRQEALRCGEVTTRPARTE